MKLHGHFERKLEESLLEEAADEATGQQGLVMQAVAQSHVQLRRFKDEYNVEPIIDSFAITRAGPVIDPVSGRVRVTWKYTHDATEYFEFGTSFHRVDGNPILSFVWEDPPQWVTEVFDQARSSGGQFRRGYRVFLSSVHVAGIQETRFIRHGLRWLRHELER